MLVVVFMLKCIVAYFLLKAGLDYSENVGPYYGSHAYEACIHYSSTMAHLITNI